MCRCGNDLFYIILFARGLAGDSSAAPVLSLICVNSLALDIAEMSECNDDVFLLDQGFIIDVFKRTVDDLRNSGCSKLILDFCHLRLDDVIKQSLVGKNSVEILDLFGQSLDLSL